MSLECVYPKELPLKELPYEKKMLTIGMYGNVDFYDLKEAVEILLIDWELKMLNIYLRKAI